MFEADEMEGCHSCKYGENFDTEKEPCKYCYGLSRYTRKEVEMGTIIYKPHCARCGAIINQEVTYRGVAEEIAKNCLYSGSLIEIEPYRCTCCGEIFGTIEIPMPKEREE